MEVTERAQVSGPRRAVHAAEDHAVGDLRPSAGHTMDLPHGDERAGVDRRERAPGEGPAVRTRVVVAPEIAVQIAAAFTSGTNLATLANQWHLTPGEVARVVAGPEAHSGPCLP